MLKKINRLQKDRDFQKVFKGSRITKTENLVFRVRERPDQKSKVKSQNYNSKFKSDEILNQVQDDKDSEHRRNERSYKLTANSPALPAGGYQLPRGARFGFVVSNKVNKRATRRNALKRRLRAAVRELLPTLLPDIDVVVVVKRDFSYPYDYQEIKKQIGAGLAKLT